MGLFNRKKEVPVSFFKAKAGVFLERLNNGVITQENYNRVIDRIIFLERILERYPFYKLYRQGNIHKRDFLANLKGFYRQLMEDGMSQKEFYEIIQQVELDKTVTFQNIFKEEINWGNIKGTIFKVGQGHINGIVLAHAIVASRYNLLNLADVLSRMGYLVLAIDLPKHNMNQGMDLTFGNMAELIRDSVIYLRKIRGMKNVAIIGDSLGSIGTLLASAGYTVKVERDIYVLWERIRQSIEKCEGNSRLQAKAKDVTLQDILNDKFFMDCLNEVTACYNQIKKIILQSLKERDQLGIGFVDCCILLSMPTEAKKVFIGASLLRKLPDRWLKSIIKAIHNHQVNLVMKEGNTFGYMGESNDAIKVWYLKIDSIREFIDYFASVKEPADFIRLMNILCAFAYRKRGAEEETEKMIEEVRLNLRARNILSIIKKIEGMYKAVELRSNFEVLKRDDTIELINGMRRRIELMQRKKAQSMAEARERMNQLIEMEVVIEKITGEKIKETRDTRRNMEMIERMKNGNKYVSLIDYYRRKYILSVPKLFIYGNRDVLLRPFMPGSRRKIEETYRAYGNAQIIRGNYNHFLLKKEVQSSPTIAVTSDVVFQNIISFVNKYIGLKSS